MSNISSYHQVFYTSSKKKGIRQNEAFPKSRIFALNSLQTLKAPMKNSFFFDETIPSYLKSEANNSFEKARKFPACDTYNFNHLLSHQILSLPPQSITSDGSSLSRYAESVAFDTFIVSLKSPTFFASASYSFAFFSITALFSIAMGICKYEKSKEPIESSEKAINDNTKSPLILNFIYPKEFPIISSIFFSSILNKKPFEKSKKKKKKRNRKKIVIKHLP